MLEIVGSAHTIGERFEILELAGTGGAASVYRALDRHTRQPVAVKLLRTALQAEAIERFAREAALLSQLSHPGIVRYVSHGRNGAEIFLAMEWLDGMTLSQRLAKGGLTVDESLAAARGIAEALGVAHAKGIVHRDVKPGNVFLVEGDPGRIKLLDFGIARLRSGSAELTQKGMVIGTPGYMAPEQARGEKDLDARADVFALGCVLFRCLTGRSAFSGADVVAVLAKVLLEEAPLIRTLCPDVPAAVEQLVAQLLAKRPIDRPADGNAVRAAIEALGGGGEAEPVTTQLGPALTTDERRLMCVVLARAAGGANREALRAAITAHGGHLDVLADGSLLVTAFGVGTPSDQAARAARCALAMRALEPRLPIVLVAGEGEMKGRVAVGRVIDRGAMLLAGVDPGGPVRLDDVAAGFLDGRFEVRAKGACICLEGEREGLDRSRAFLGRPSTCVGRARELATLGGIWAECVEESVARIALVTGPTGIGKSRVLEEFLVRVRATSKDLEIWTGRGEPMSARSPFGMIAEPIRRAAGIRGGDSPAERQRKLAARAEALLAPADVRRVAEFLAEIIGAPVSAGESVELQAARHDPQLLGDQMRRAWEDWLDAEARARPILLVLEDLHWGDLPSVKFVDAAARHLADRPFMVLALARPEVHERFPEIWAERDVVEVPLRPLTEKAAARLVAGALGAQASAATVQRIVERGDGNAFFLEELVRAIAAGKGDELPTTVLAMVQARLGGLSVEARRLLRAASVFGRVFSIDGALALLGGEEAASSRPEQLAELVAKDVLQRPADARFHGELAFRHALVHEAAYSMLTEADRKLGHRLAAEWLERSGEADPVALAEHFERGGELSRAVGWYWRAAEQALSANDHQAAIERAEKAISCGAGGEDEGALRLIESEARRWRSENEAAKRAAEQAMRLLGRGSPGWCNAASEVAMASSALGDTQALVALAADLKVVKPAGGSSELVAALARVARPLFWAGKHVLAAGALVRARTLEQRSPGLQPTALASLYMARGVEARLIGDPSECVRCNELAVAESQRAGDLRTGSVVRGNLGYAFLEIGAYEEAQAVLEEALADATRLGLPLVVATAQQNLGLALGRRGAFAEAVALERTSIAAFEAQGDVRRAGCSLLYLALVELEHGRPQEADETIGRALAMLAQHPPLRCNALAVRAQIKLACGEVERGIASASEAYELFTHLGSIDEGESRVRLVNAEARFAAGDSEGAIYALGEAVDCLRARASKIANGARRRAFLEAIPENRRTLELTQAWGVRAGFL